MNYSSLTSIPFLQVLGILLFPVVIVLVVWTLIIKGLALWKSARNGHKRWFVVLLIINSLGILELIYLIWFAKREKAPDVPSSGTLEA